MNDELYRVVFTGRLVDGVPGKQALDNLARLFRKTPDEIRTVFSKPGTVIRSNLPLIKAERILAGLTQAGVICQLQVMPASATVATSSASTAPISRSSAQRTGGQMLTLVLAPTDLTLAPISCGRLSAHDGGLETPRLDRSFIAYTDILAATVFTPKESGVNLKLLLFTVGHKRPLLVEGMQIAFTDFPDVPGANLPVSLRNFLHFLVAQNPDLCVDEKTGAFMRGAVPPLFRDEPVLLSSQVHQALVSAGLNLQRTPINAPTPGTVAAPRPAARPATAVTTLPPASQPEPAEPVREIDVRAELEGWVDRWSLLLSIVLLTGFFLPLLKHSLLFDSVYLVWFWNLLGFNLDQQQLAVMATDASDRWMALYALLPLFSALLVMLAAFVAPKRWRGLILLLAGLVPLLLAFTVLHTGGAVFGIIFLPVTAAGGGMMLALLFAALLVATVNHLGKLAINHLHLRLLQGLGALLLLLLTILAFIAPDWNNFALYLLYLVWLFIALLALKGAISGTGGQPLVSFLFRVALMLTPIAVIVAQSQYDNPYVTYVVASGGGLIPLIIACIKAFLIYYGMAMTAGVGLVQVLGRRYAGR